MMPQSLTRISLALLLLLSSEVWALGLGEVRLQSSLNEPLRAEIELLAASAEEVQNLQVALASPATFDRYGLERPYYLQNLSFEVVRSGRADGNYVRVRSQSPMTEPFLTFLIEAVWANGRLLREYTVLLDPPTFTPESATPAQPQVTAPERAAPADSGRIERAAPPATAAPAPATPRQPAPEPAQPPASAAPTTAPEAAPESTAPYDAAAGGDYSVVRGDTLWGIASRVRPDSRLTMNQTMLAIFEANPEAFGGNINILRADSRLRIPSADDIRRIDRNDAFNEASRQNAEWGGAAPVAAPAPAPAPQPEADTRPSLTLVPPDEEPAGPETGVAGEPTEEPVTREQEILDRIAELEAADVPEERALIEIRDNELANLRRELADIRGEVYEPPVEEEVDPFADEEPVADDADETAEDQLFPDFDEPAGEDADEAADEAAEAAPDATTTISRRPSEPSLVDTVTGWLTNVWVLLGVALLAVIAILAWFMRRGGGDEPDAWGARLEPDVADDETMVATESLRAPKRRDESIVVVEQSGRFKKREEETARNRRPKVADDDETTGTFGSLEDTFSSETAVNLDQSDPIAEADFHMAYGLYDQAADLVNGALRAEPERRDLLTKLCEIYFVWGNRDAFVNAAERLYAVTGGDSDDWDKIVIMGQQIAADHEMFAGAGVAGATKAVDLSFDDEDAAGIGALDMDFGADSADGDDVIDLGGGDDDVIDLGGGDDDVLDFDFDDDTSTAKTVEMPASERTVETPTLEEPFEGFEGTSRLPSLDEDTDRRPRVSRHSADATAEIDLDDLGLDLDGLAATELASLDDDDATELASLDDLDDLDETGTNEAVEETQDTGRNPQVDPDDTGMLDELDVDDDFSSTRTGMRLAADETGVSPALSSAEETDVDIEEDLLAATGRTQVLPEDFAVETFADDDDATIGDNDKTMLAGRLTDDFDYAKTEALPAGSYPGDDDVTGEVPAIGSTDVDLDLDDLTEALKRTDKGDTVEQVRDDATVEHRRPALGNDGVDTVSFGPDELADDLEDARTMTEVGTKLDLARAYVDMGDPAGARSILEEVLDEGDSSQRQQAQRLLDSLPS